MTNLDEYFPPRTRGRKRGSCHAPGCTNPTEVRVQILIRDNVTNVTPARTHSKAANFCLEHGSALYEGMVVSLNRKED
jgi:hypothetical protein